MVNCSNEPNDEAVMVKSTTAAEPIESGQVGTGTEQADPGALERAARREVGLNGWGFLADGTCFALSVLDLSYDGCRLKPEIALLPGVKFKMSIVGFQGAVDAEVRWHKQGCAGVKFAAAEVAGKPQVARSYDREAVNSVLELRRLGRKQYQARMFDLAPGGCKVEFIERPRPGELIRVKLDGLDSIEAVVRWVDGYYGGVEFVRPIHSAIYDSLLARLKAA
jgi:hypothetical protein